MWTLCGAALCLTLEQAQRDGTKISGLYALVRNERNRLRILADLIKVFFEKSAGIRAIRKIRGLFFTFETLSEKRRSFKANLTSN
jgi:hypothetical protein